MTLELLASYPGLHQAWTPERPYFERAYRAGSDVARVRFVPVGEEPAELGANIPVLPRHIAMLASASLVDPAGQVIIVNGRGLIRPPQSFVHAIGELTYDEGAFLLKAATSLVTELLAYRSQTSGSLLIPPPMTAGA